jgi:hypothetical protein
VPKPGDQSYFVPTPSRWTVFLRTFLPWQLVRFVWINLKMIRMISIGNHGQAPMWILREIEIEAHRPRPLPAPRP